MGDQFLETFCFLQARLSAMPRLAFALPHHIGLTLIILLARLLLEGLVTIFMFGYLFDVVIQIFYEASLIT